MVTFDDPTPREPLGAEVPVLALRWPEGAREPVVHRFTWPAETVAAFLVDWSARAGAPRPSLEEACATVDPGVVRATLARVAPRTVATPASATVDALVWCPSLP